jgi:NTP pyrophosphatase (non-canonical NTP hydrolase)
MDPSKYQQLAGRTECNQWESRDRMICYRPYDVHDSRSEDRLQPIRVNHAIIGMTGEIGELAGALERWIYYGQPMDLTNLKEEIGDVLWYLALLCNATGLDLSEVMEANLRKLAVRYPERYNRELAVEENRDRESERNSINA